MRAIQRQARIAGLLYLALAIIAPIGLMYVPGKILVAGDAAATAENLRIHAGLFRLGIASELAHQALAVFLVLALYRLFEPVSKLLARHLVALGALVSVPIAFVNVLNEVAAATLAQGPAYLAAFDRAQLDALGYLFLRLHARGLDVASIFWGLWLFPFALLILRSRFIPRVFGWLMLPAGVAYFVNAFVTLCLPELAPRVGPIAMLLYLGEVPIIFYLAIRGARPVPEGAPVAG
jgi:hypothetical protein